MDCEKKTLHTVYTFIIYKKILKSMGQCPEKHGLYVIRLKRS